MSDRPNVVVVLTDQQHTNTLGCYGNEIVSTPHIDGLAGDGVVFENHFVTVPLCVPSRASLWSAQYPHCNGVMVNDDGRGISFPDSIPTLGDVAKAAGYVCGYIGKWHIGREGTAQHGFTDAWWTHLRGSYEQQLEESGVISFEDGMTRMQQRGKVPFELAHDTMVATRTIDFLREHRYDDFLCVCSMRAPHDPYIGPFDDLYDPADVPLPPSLTDTLEGKPQTQWRGVPRRWFEAFIGSDPKSYNVDEMRRITARYWGLVHLVDANVGRVLAAIDELGLAENTVVLFMSDHGDQMGAHGVLVKGLAMYDDTTRVPLIVRWPGHIPAGKGVPHLTSMIDVVPTLLDLMGLAATGEMQGESMRQLWDYAYNRREVVFMETYESYFLSGPIYSARTQNWKYNWYVGDIDELYDLSEDPHEMRNLAFDARHRETLLGLRSMIVEWLEKTGDVRISSLGRIAPGVLPQRIT